MCVRWFWPHKGRCGIFFFYKSLFLRKRDHWHSFCVQVIIYSTININRLREDWRRKNNLWTQNDLHSSQIYNAAWKKKKEKKQKPLQVDSIFGNWANKTWTHTPARDHCRPQQAVLRSVLPLNFHSTLTLALQRRATPRRTLKTYTTFMSSKTNQPWCLYFQCILTSAHLHGGWDSCTRFC